MTPAASSVKLTIDGREISVEPGTTIIDAARRLLIAHGPQAVTLKAVAAEVGYEDCLRITGTVRARHSVNDKIATGKAENKFGIPISRAREVYTHAGKLKGLKVAGVDMHIGSQITNLDPFDSAFALLAEFVGMLRADGHTILHVDLGGGLGIPYRDDNEPPPHPDDYAKMVKRATRDLDCRLIFEPGRLLVGNAGILVTRVLFVKHGEAKNFVVVDAAMNDLMRPTLYEAYHEILPVVEPAAGTPIVVTDVAGPVCETGDYLALARPLPELRAGDLISVMTAGAYGAVLASEYNSRLLVPEVLVAGNKYSVTRQRPSYDDMLAKELLPNWL